VPHAQHTAPPGSPANRLSVPPSVPSSPRRTAGPLAPAPPPDPQSSIQNPKSQIQNPSVPRPCIRDSDSGA
jgi:hypothetical protein